MALTNAERQRAWRERHKDEPSAPRDRPKVSEVAALRARVAELEGILATRTRAPVLLSFERSAAPDAQLKHHEQQIDLLCPTNSPNARGWIGIVVSLAEYHGAEALIDAFRRFIATLRARDVARDAADMARMARAKTKRQRQAALRRVQTATAPAPPP